MVKNTSRETVKKAAPSVMVIMSAEEFGIIEEGAGLNKDKEVSDFLKAAALERAQKLIDEATLSRPRNMVSVKGNGRSMISFHGQ